MVHVDVKLGPFLLELPTSGSLEERFHSCPYTICPAHLYGDQVVMVSSPLQGLQNQAGLLSHEGPLGSRGEVGDTGNITHAAGIIMAGGCQEGA